MTASRTSKSTTEAAGTTSAAYRRLEHEGEAPARELRDYSAAWERLQPLAAVNGTLRERIESFAASKHVSLEALEALGTRVDVRGKGPEIRLAWAYPALRGGRVIVPALKFRDVATGAREARKPSVFLEPLVIGERRSLDWFLAEGETDAARLYDLVGDAAAVMVLPAGALTFKGSWASWVPRGATIHLAHDADETGDMGAEKAARVLGGKTVRIRPPNTKDWCDWEGGRDEFVRLVAEARTEIEAAVFDVLTARELCALPDPPASEGLLGPLVVRGRRLVLGGHTGEGKTTMTLELVRAVVSRGEFLEWEGAGGRALVLDAEQGLATVKRRLREAGLEERDDVDYVRIPDGLSLDSDPRHVAAVEETLERGNYVLVVADPLYKLHRGDSNDEREAVDLMRRFDGWRERYGFALAVPVHCRKPIPGTKFSIHDIFGSSAYVRGADVVLGLHRVSDGYARLHFLKDRDGDLPIGTSWGLLFSREEGYRRDPNDGKPSTAQRVRELRAERPYLTQAQVAEELGVTERTVRKYWTDEDEETLLDGAA